MSRERVTADERCSAECTLAQRPGYTALHQRCTRTEDIPLPHSVGVLLVHRCECVCHIPKHLRRRPGPQAR